MKCVGAIVAASSVFYHLIDILAAPIRLATRASCRSKEWHLGLVKNSGAIQSQAIFLHFSILSGIRDSWNDSGLHNYSFCDGCDSCAAKVIWRVSVMV